MLRRAVDLGVNFIDTADSYGPNVSVQLKATPSQVALAWLLWRSAVMLPIPGTSRVQHLEENGAAAGLEINKSEFKQLRRSASAN